MIDCMRGNKLKAWERKRERERERNEVKNKLTTIKLN